MSSKSDVLLGGQQPRIAHAPKFLWSHAEDAAFLSSSYGLTADPWQFLVIESWLGEDRNGLWTAGRCGLAVPRQNGKNGALEIRELYGIVALGEKFLHTAHEVKTARKAFTRLASFFENERLYPELAAMVREIRKTNGQEAIVLKNGGSVEFVARSRGSGRGYTVDVLVCDEAQELTDEQLEALLPTISAAPSGNPQTIFTGTPPGPTSPGEVFTRVRTAGVLGKDRRLSWHEWSCEGAIDITDRNLWAATNPALGRRLNITVVQDELPPTMSVDGFARERLGMWSSSSHLAVIPAVAWEKRATLTPPTEGAVAYALDMSPDRATIAISVARKTGGSVHVECFEHRSTALGTAWAIDLLVERWSKATAIVIDGQSPAMSLVPELLARHVKVTVTGAGDMAKACGLLYDAILSDANRLTHFNQPALNAALAGAKKRDIGQAGGWGWNRKDPSVDITPLVSVTLAHYGVLTSKRHPGRTARAVVMS